MPAPIRNGLRALSIASLRSSPRQPTSPVELISTPSTGSAFCRRANENWLALTPMRSWTVAYTRRHALSTENRLLSSDVNGFCGLGFVWAQFLNPQILLNAYFADALLQFSRRILDGDSPWITHNENAFAYKVRSFFLFFQIFWPKSSFLIAFPTALRSIHQKKMWLS